MANRMTEIAESNNPISTDNIQKESYRINCIKNWSIVIAIVAAILFFGGCDCSDFLTWCKIDTNVLGTYGDFIGGFIGTGVTLYSAYLLFITLKEQNVVNRETQKVNTNVISTNNAVVKTNKIIIAQSYLQLFDNKFTTFLSLYQHALDAYRYNNKKGREAFVNIMDSFLEKPFQNGSTYMSRTKVAVKEYEQIYAANCREMSVHLRMLYHVARLIGMAENEDDDGNTILDEENRVIYAKCLRAQLCDEEMIMLRYNCLTNKGRNMQEFVNQFNLIKHIPLMSLLEFKKWKAKIGVDEALVSCMNAHFIALRKFILESCIGESEGNVFLDSRKYNIQVVFEDSNKNLIITVTLKNVTGSPGHEGEMLIDKALSKFRIEDLKELYKEYLKEILLVSNFYQFNGSDGRRIDSRLSTDRTKVICTAENDYPWILASWQRENP